MIPSLSRIRIKVYLRPSNETIHSEIRQDDSRLYSPWDTFSPAWLVLDPLAFWSLMDDLVALEASAAGLPPSVSIRLHSIGRMSQEDLLGHCNVD